MHYAVKDVRWALIREHTLENRNDFVMNAMLAVTLLPPSVRNLISLGTRGWFERDLLLENPSRITT